LIEKIEKVTIRNKDLHGLFGFDALNGHKVGATQTSQMTALG
jgi:hypothetical protein